MAGILEGIGVRFHYRTRVTDIHVRKGRVAAVISAEDEQIACDTVLIATGEMPAFLSMHFPNAPPTVPLRGHTLGLPTVEPFPRLSIADPAQAISFSRIADMARVSGGKYLRSETIEQHGIERLKRVASNIYPHLSEDLQKAQVWSGTRHMTPTTLPVIMKSTTTTGLHASIGHGMIGWTMCLGAAKALADQIEQNR
jgi:D-amino-acid dehydrogenase